MHTIELEKQIALLSEENLQLTKKLEFARKHSDTVFCSSCDKQCNREQIICAVCQVMNPSCVNERKKVYICSPLQGDGSKQAKRANMAKAKDYASKAFKEGYAPVVPHLFYPIFLDDNIPEEREFAIQAGLAQLVEVAGAGGEFWVCADEFESKGMKTEIQLAEVLGLTVQYRYDHPRAKQDHVTATESVLTEAADIPQKASATDEQRSKKVVWAEKQIEKFKKAKDHDGIKRIKIWAKKNLESRDLQDVMKSAHAATVAMRKAA